MSKPRIKRLVDNYAIASGEFWVCSYGGVCARGKTPVEAYDKLYNHFAFLRSASKMKPTATRMFA